MLEKEEKRRKRHKKIRAKVFGTALVPRLSVFKSGKHIYAQLINDEKAETMAAADDSEFKKNREKKIDQAKKVGKLIADLAKNLKIEKVVFDRGGYKYHGRIKALADGAREAGLKF
jgi:large subunit ribosomal protein L18